VSTVTRAPRAASQSGTIDGVGSQLPRPARGMAVGQFSGCSKNCGTDEVQRTSSSA
jgi:hypothetical protein